MAYSPILRLTLAHDYYAPGAPPISVRPHGPKAFNQAGLLLRQTGAEVLVIADQDDTDRPDSVALDLVAQNPDLFQLTQGADWPTIMKMDLAIGDDTPEFDATGSRSQKVGGRLLAELSVALQPGTPRQITLRFHAVTAYWAYHVTGRGLDEALQIIDSDDTAAVSFSDLGQMRLPDGTPARVIRSDLPLPARARPATRFSLKRQGPFGPEVLIPVLPSASASFRTISEPDSAPRLQSDIYVSLI